MEESTVLRQAVHGEKEVEEVLLSSVLHAACAGLLRGIAARAGALAI